MTPFGCAGTVLYLQCAARTLKLLKGQSGKVEAVEHFCVSSMWGFVAARPLHLRTLRVCARRNDMSKRHIGLSEVVCTPA